MIICMTDIDQGKTTEVDTNNLGASASILFKMASSLPTGDKFILFANKFSSSLPLTQKLKKMQNFVCWHNSTAKDEKVPFHGRKRFDEERENCL